MHSKDKPKQFLEIHGKPIIIHTLEHFEKCAAVDAVVVACVGEWLPHLTELVARYGMTKVARIVAGGETGQLSIYAGLLAAKEVAGGKKAIALVHDGVRPLISPELLAKNVECVIERGNCITAGAVKETIVVTDEHGKIIQITDRSHSRVAKAPQSFYLDELLAAHERALSEGVRDSIDSCTLMKRYGAELYMIDGPFDNIKITTPDDYFTMRAILDVRENGQIYSD